MRHFFAAAVLLLSISSVQAQPAPAASQVDPLTVIGELVLGNVQQGRTIETLRAQLGAAQSEVKRLKDKYEPEPAPKPEDKK